MLEELFVDLTLKADIIINCSPVGMYPKVDISPVSCIKHLAKETVLCDLIYNPLETKLLQMGKEHGLKVINGLPMFLYQGALSFEYMTGHSAPLKIMREVVTNQIK